MLRITNRSLEKAGFGIGVKIKVEYKKNLLLITKQ
jgi:hypothetical protein